MKNRPARVKELLLRELGSIIAREYTFSAKLVTVHAVDLSADFKHAHVHVGVLGTERERRDAIHKLEEHRPLLQRELSKRVILKYTPHLHFHLDEAVERGTKVMEIMRQMGDVPPAQEDEPILADARMDAEEPIGNTEELIRVEEQEDAEGADLAADPEAVAKPRRDALNADPARPRGRRAQDAARAKESPEDE